MTAKQRGPQIPTVRTSRERTVKSDCAQRRSARPYSFPAMQRTPNHENNSKQIHLILYDMSIFVAKNTLSYSIGPQTAAPILLADWTRLCRPPCYPDIPKRDRFNCGSSTGYSAYMAVERCWAQTSRESEYVYIINTNWTSSSGRSHWLSKDMVRSGVDQVTQRWRNVALSIIFSDEKQLLGQIRLDRASAFDQLKISWLSCRVDSLCLF